MNILKTYVKKIKANDINTFFSELTNFLKEKKAFKKNPKQIIQEFQQREEEGTTNLGEGFAFPHILSKHIINPMMVVCQLEKPILYGDSEVSLVIALAFSTKMKGDEHLKVISKYSSKLIDPKYVEHLKNTTPNKLEIELNKFNQTIFNPINQKEAQKATLKPNDFKFNVVAITTCPTGVAHTHLAADYLLKFAKQKNIGMKVERQAAGGTEDMLTSEDIEQADYVLIAAGKDVEKSRFVGKKLYEIGISKAIKNTSQVLDDLPNNAQVYASSSSKEKSSQTMVRPGVKLRHHNPIMNALMNGLSYMIPIVITGGLLLAIGICFGLITSGQKDPANVPSTNFFHVLTEIGGAAFTVMIPILGGYIAYAIGDRAAMAPAFILSLLFNMPGNKVGDRYETYTIWNWQQMHFGFDSNSANGTQLGFFGAIAFGLLSGYLVKLIQTKKYPRALQTLMPIMIIPLTVTFVLWVMTAFFLSLPLIYLSVGLSWVITTLNEKNLFWLMGIALGLMICFDLGGPVNKIAVFLGIEQFTNQNYLVMGADAVAIGIPPIGMALGVLIRHLIKRDQDASDRELAKTAAIIGSFGITEGAIPYVVKNPRLIFANLAGGAVGGGLAGLFKLGCIAGHGSIIVFLLGAIGHQPQGQNFLSDNYTYGLLFFVCLFAGAGIVALIYYFTYKPVKDKGLASVLE